MQIRKIKKLISYLVIIFTTFIINTYPVFAQGISEVNGQKQTFLEDQQILYIVFAAILGSLYGFGGTLIYILKSRKTTTDYILEQLADPGKALKGKTANRLIRLLNRNNTSLISSLTEANTIVLIITTMIILGLSGIIRSDGIISILSAIVGYVLGSSKAYKSSEEEKEETLEKEEIEDQEGAIGEAKYQGEVEETEKKETEQQSRNE